MLEYIGSRSSVSFLNSDLYVVFLCGSFLICNIYMLARFWSRL